jgi:glucosamine-6-phosphate deaminase
MRRARPSVRPQHHGIFLFMKTTQPLATHTVGKARVAIYPTDADMGAAAAVQAASLIRDAIAERGGARIMVGTGNSQRTLID